MELHRNHGSPLPHFFPSPFLFHNHQSLADNYVHWFQTPDSHLFSADLPGFRKEEIRVELEDYRYLVIRTELRAMDGGRDGERTRKEFMRKFRLPPMVDVERISAAFEDGLLTVRVPRAIAAVARERRQLRIELAGDVAENILRGRGAAPAA